MTGKHAQRRPDGVAPAPTGRGGRHVAARSRGGRGFGPWQHLQHGFASGRGASVLLAVLALVTTTFLVALPQLAAGAQDRGIADAVRSAGSAERDLTLRLTPRAIEGVALPSSTTGATASPPWFSAGRPRRPPGPRR